MTHWRLAWLKPRSVSMWGSAMFTMVPSSTIMSCAAQMTKSARPRRFGGVSWEVNSPVGSFTCSTVVDDMGVPREDDAVHELGDAVRPGSTSGEQRLVDRQGRQDHQQGVEVGVGADLTSLSGVLEDGAGGLELRGQEPLVDAVRQLWLTVSGSCSAGQSMNRPTASMTRSRLCGQRR